MHDAWSSPPRRIELGDEDPIVGAWRAADEKMNIRAALVREE